MMLLLIDFQEVRDQIDVHKVQIAALQEEECKLEARLDKVKEIRKLWEMELRGLRCYLSGMEEKCKLMQDFAPVAGKPTSSK